MAASTNKSGTKRSAQDDETEIKAKHPFAAADMMFFERNRPSTVVQQNMEASLVWMEEQQEEGDSDNEEMMRDLYAQALAAMLHEYSSRIVRIKDTLDYAKVTNRDVSTRDERARELTALETRSWLGETASSNQVSPKFWTIGTTVHAKSDDLSQILSNEVLGEVAK